MALAISEIAPGQTCEERLELLAEKYQEAYDHDMNALVNVSEVLGDIRSLLAVEYLESLRG